MNYSANHLTSYDIFVMQDDRSLKPLRVLYFIKFSSMESCIDTLWYIVWILRIWNLWWNHTPMTNNRYRKLQWVSTYLLWILFNSIPLHVYWYLCGFFLFTYTSWSFQNHVLAPVPVKRTATKKQNITKHPYCSVNTYWHSILMG